MIAKLKAGLKAGLQWFEFGPTLRNRLLIIIVSTSLTIVLVSTLLFLNYQRRQLIESAQSATTGLSNAIKANLNHAMITMDREMMTTSVLDVVAEGAVDSIRIFDDQGLVGVSSIEGEVGTRYTQAESLCQACHVVDGSTRTNNIVYTADNRREVLLNVNLIENKQECYPCHGSENRVLGLMMIESSLGPVTEQLQMGFWRTMLVALVSFALLVGLIVPALNRIIVRPINDLTRGAAEISSGNFDHRVPVRTRDELGRLAQSFDDMREQLKISRAAMELREQELATLNEVGLAATQLLDLEAILALAVNTMVDKLGMEEVLIYLQDGDSERFTVQASYGVSQAQIEEIERRRQAGDDITQEIVETGKVVFVPNMVDDLRFHGVWEQLDHRSYVKLPLMSRGTVVGVLGVITPVGQPLTFHDVEFLKVIGREIGIAIDNANLLADTKRREEQAVTLYKLGRDISASLALDDVLVTVARAARELVSADIGLVGLLDEEFKELIVKAVVGTQTDLILSRPIKVSEQPPWCDLEAGQPYFAQEDTPVLQNFHPEDLLAKEQVQSVLVVPLRRGKHFLGLIEVMSRTPRPFSQRDGRLLLRLATQVVVAIENAQLYNQLHHLVTLEERDRLARELHDHLAQGLGYLKVKTSITEDLLAGGHFEKSRDSLLELKKASQILYTDVREQIFNLRTAVTEREDFFSTLRDYLSSYQTHYGLNVHILIENECPTEFAPEVASQLLRIIQEALTNVRRHSDADKVLIQCVSGGEQVRISIEDDGRGFHPTHVAQDGGQRYGLQIMRERAESVGGSLELDSQPGQGTRVIVRVPPTV